MPRTVVITGGTGGIGYQSALGIAKGDTTSTTVVVTGRNKERGEAAVEKLKEESGNSNIQLVIGDVSSIAKVDQLAADLKKALKKIDVLVNNAGYLGNDFEKNEDGLEMHFAVNVVAPYRLTHQLVPLLKKADGKARVINVTGGGPPMAVDVDNLQTEKGFKGIGSYKHAKAILEATTMIMSKELSDMLVVVVFPGFASTSMANSAQLKTFPGIMKLFYPLFLLQRWMGSNDGGKLASKAARSTIWAASSPDIETGKYYDTNCKETKLNPTTADPKTQDKVAAAIKAALAGK
eukprot:scaffold1304_cov82-Cylindrotheca_fusiformis.AAC.5